MSEEALKQQCCSLLTRPHRTADSRLAASRSKTSVSSGALRQSPSKAASKSIMADANAAQLAFRSEALGAVSNQTSERRQRVWL